MPKVQERPFFVRKLQPIRIADRRAGYEGIIITRFKTSRSQVNCIFFQLQVTILRLCTELRTMRYFEIFPYLSMGYGSFGLMAY